MSLFLSIVKMMLTNQLMFFTSSDFEYLFRARNIRLGYFVQCSVRIFFEISRQFHDFCQILLQSGVPHAIEDESFKYHMFFVTQVANVLMLFSRGVQILSLEVLIMALLTDFWSLF